MSLINQNDPANLAAHGISNKGEIITQPESGPPITPKRQWRTNIPVASTPAGSDGVCSAQIGPVSNGQAWFVEWARVKSNSSSPTTIEIYKNSVDDFHSVDSSGVGNDNWFSAPGSPGYWLGESEILIFVWTLADQGSIGVVNAQVLING